MGAFFYRIYEFLFSFSNPPPVVHRPHVPERYTIRFVPASAAVTSAGNLAPTSTVRSVISPVNNSVSPVISSRVFVPAELPARYAIAFVPAVSASDFDASIPPVMPVPGPVSSSD